MSGTTSGRRPPAESPAPEDRRNQGAGQAGNRRGKRARTSGSQERRGGSERQGADGNDHPPSQEKRRAGAERPRARAESRRAGPPRPRRVALEALMAVEGGARANATLAALLAGSPLDARDRALVTELVYGTCRMRRACDWLIDGHTRGRLDVEVRCALRLGTYQLGWMRIPPHAAVSATVEEVRGRGRTVVNAVLRRVADQVSAGPVYWPDPATELSYPDWIVERLARDLGPADARQALVAMNEAGRPTRRGDGYVQDRASQLVAAHVGVQPGDLVLDLCAAPGGKATAMALNRPALLVAADRADARMRVLASNVGRVNAQGVVPVLADGLRPPWRPGCFDRVLVDAPCSGLGVLHRRPDARWRVQPEDVARLSGLQRSLLTESLRLVRPGGTLVYSVCTLTAQETGHIDAWLARTAPELIPLPPPGGPWRPWGRGALLLPQVAGTDGMFVLARRVPTAAPRVDG